jgi:hypothetical protein
MKLVTTYAALELLGPTYQWKTEFYTDGDGDGFGDPASVIEACTTPAGAVDQAGDCDDGAIGTNPAALDIPQDTLDQDCDGADAPYTVADLVEDLVRRHGVPPRDIAVIAPFRAQVRLLRTYGFVSCEPDASDLGSYGGGGGGGVGPAFFSPPLTLPPAAEDMSWSPSRPAAAEA